MKTRFIYIGLAILLLGSCKKNTTTPAPPTNNNNEPKNKIMPLGASRVEGNRPQFESFRYELWKDLVENDWTFDFIGTKKDNASYPNFNGVNFDNDHEGRGGWTSGEILASLSDWLEQAGTPDIVIFSSPGGNDALQDLSYTDAIDNINAIIDILQAANPNVSIIIEQMAPGHTIFMTPKLTTYFNDMQVDVATIAANQTTATSKVIAVDMFTGFTNSLLADPVHYNAAGADFIAQRHYDALINVMEQ